MKQVVYFFGGNGHCRARLIPARITIERLSQANEVKSFEIVEAPYPGFEGRPKAAGFDAFLDAIVPSSRVDLIYGSGIGGLLALVLAVFNKLPHVPILLQAPVLWGLEKRWMPKLMRLMPHGMFDRITRTRLFQKRFARTRFLRPLDDATLRDFFDGFQQCRAGGDFFDWLTPALLRQLENGLRSDDRCLERLQFWWGDLDRVVTIQELQWTEAALKRSFPVRRFPEWGHYPMIDDPENWIRNLNHVLATTS